MDTGGIEVEALQAADLFAGIEQAHYREIMESGARRRLEAGALLFREGEPAQAFFLVMSGRLKLSKLHEQGKEAIIRYVGPGEITAAIAALAGRGYPATAQALHETEVVAWRRQTAVEMLLEHPRLAVNVLRVVVTRLDELQDRYLELRAEQVEQRIARSLLRIMRQSGRRQGDDIAIDFRLSRQDLADYTGTTLYTVSRTLSAWEKRGWIRSRREHITVCDPHSLVLFAEGD